jgi:YVTN family beta-propeller protein
MISDELSAQNAGPQAERQSGHEYLMKRVLDHRASFWSAAHSAACVSTAGGAVAWFKRKSKARACRALPTMVRIFAVVMWVQVSLPARADLFDSVAPVGQFATNTFITPANRLLTPAGRQVDLPGLRPQALALSPDGRLLLVSGATPELIIIEPKTGAVIQHVPLPVRRGESDAPVSGHILRPEKDAQVSYTGLVFSPDGTRLYLSSVSGTIKVFLCGKRTITPLGSFDLPPANAPGRAAEIPAGLAISRDGRRLFVVLNLSNRLAEIDAFSGQLLHATKTGVAPYDVVLARGKAYVSNWGGRRPEPGSTVGPAGRGTTVRVDSARFIANEGSVSIIPLEKTADKKFFSSGQSPREILTGLHASALALSPDQKYVVVANSGSDTLSVIDTRRDEIVETISTRDSPDGLFGAIPDALVFDRSGDRLFVCNAAQDAVAVVHFLPGRSRLLGLIPVGWFPGAIVVNPRHRYMAVANIKGVGSGLPPDSGEKSAFQTHQFHGTVSLVPFSEGKELARQTETVLRNLRAPRLAAARLPARPDQPPRPVPERTGEPSVFQHVIYIIKENRTYDQVLGDMPAGNGAPDLCVFGERVTPNQHELCRQFVLLDNTCCSGVLSADGHQWATTGITTDYMERSFAGFPRSYPDGMEDDDVDALAYSPAGFLWDNALAHGISFRDYGEFAISTTRWADPKRRGEIGFRDVWQDWTQRRGAILIGSRPAIESIRPHLCTNTVGWDLNVPDVLRAERFIQELRGFERSGNFPRLSIICLPNDHTSGTKPGMPTPEAHVADNDVALGRIVEAVSHSVFWTNTCILAIEDDPQSGWDHVSAYRTTAYVASPYTRRGAVIHTHYNQTSVLRTIELILGLPPMNQMDATATPMSDCFNLDADVRPFAALTNNVGLDTLNPPAKRVADGQLRHAAELSSRLPLSSPDKCPDDELNRILWLATKGPKVPYPSSVASGQDD